MYVAFIFPQTCIYYIIRSSGVENGNLRELALARMQEFGIDCRDVRTREVGIQEVHHKVRPYEVSRIFNGEPHSVSSK